MLLLSFDWDVSKHGLFWDRNASTYCAILILCDCLIHRIWQWSLVGFVILMAIWLMTSDLNRTHTFSANPDEKRAWNKHIYMNVHVRYFFRKARSTNDYFFLNADFKLYVCKCMCTIFNTELDNLYNNFGG